MGYLTHMNAKASHFVFKPECKNLEYVHIHRKFNDIDTNFHKKSESDLNCKNLPQMTRKIQAFVKYQQQQNELDDS